MMKFNFIVEIRRYHLRDGFVYFWFRSCISKVNPRKGENRKSLKSTPNRGENESSKMRITGAKPGNEAREISIKQLHTKSMFSLYLV